MTSAFDPHRIPVRVYYEDTDVSGVVYHASYLRFLERGRTEFLRELGIAQSTLLASPERIGFAVRHMTLDFRDAARMDDTVSVETRAVAVGGASVTMHQAVKRGGRVLVAAAVKIACVEEGRARRLPAVLAGRLRESMVPGQYRRANDMLTVRSA